MKRQTQNDTNAALLPATPTSLGDGETVYSDTYNVCHSCQKAGMRNCSEFDKCGQIKTYPFDLRVMVMSEYAANASHSVIAEKAFDMGLAHSQSLDIRRVLEYVAENAHMTYNTNTDIHFDSKSSGHRTIVIDRIAILAMQPEIEKILKEK